MGRITLMSSHFRHPRVQAICEKSSNMERPATIGSLNFTRCPVSELGATFGSAYSAVPLPHSIARLFISIGTQFIRNRRARGVSPSSIPTQCQGCSLRECPEAIAISAANFRQQFMTRERDCDLPFVSSEWLVRSWEQVATARMRICHLGREAWHV
jgi:hypothetical protein